VRLFFGLLLGAFIAGGADMQARTPERPLIRVSCPTDAPHLCQALIQVVSDMGTGGAVVRQVPRGAEAPTLSGDIGIALLMQTISDSTLSGHLAWQTADQPMQSGPTLRMDQLDAPMTPASYRSFAEQLLQTSSGIVSALR